MIDRLDHLRWMILGREADERCAALYRQNEIKGGSVFSGKGQEAYSTAGALSLRRWTATTPGDWYAPLIRDTAGRFAFGEPLQDGMRTYLGRATGPMGGREGNIHRGNPRRGELPMISHLGTSAATMTGVLMARRILGTLGDSIGLINIGDGGMQTGAFHEGLNVAAVEKVPLVVLVADNQLSYSTFSDRTYACRSLIDRAIGYGVAGHQCDGTDFDACRITVETAVQAARAGKGPQMVVATLLRLRGHGEHDDNSYVTAEMRARFGDCIEIADQRMRAEGIDTAPLWAEAQSQVAAAIADALGEPLPDPQAEVWQARSVMALSEWRAERQL